MDAAGLYFHALTIPWEMATMNRLAERINDCKHLCCHNYQMIPELWGLLDAQNGTRTSLAKVLPKELKAYERSYQDGLLLLSIEKEVKDGSHQSQLTAHVCHEATT
jgi:hypothetical protein